MKCTKGYDRGCKDCASNWVCDSAEKQSKPATVQSAEEFARGLLRHGVFDCGLRDCKACPDHLKAWVRDIEDDRAAQRQAGREEREGELEAMHEAWCDDIKQRYAALVEAVRRRVDPTARCDECLLTELTKALRDLDEARKG